MSRDAWSDSLLSDFFLAGLTGAPCSVMLESDSRLAVTLFRLGGLGGASSSVMLTSDSLLDAKLFRLGGLVGAAVKRPFSCAISQTSSEQTEDSRDRLSDFLLGGRIGTPFSSTEAMELWLSVLILGSVDVSPDNDSLLILRLGRGGGIGASSAVEASCNDSLLTLLVLGGR